MVCSQHRHRRSSPLVNIRRGQPERVEYIDAGLDGRVVFAYVLRYLVHWTWGLGQGSRRVPCDSLVGYTRARRSLECKRLSRAPDESGGLLMDARCLFVAR
jgi:hypothetical protein